MNYEDYIQDALDQVSAWELAESEFTDAVNAQARLMAGQGMDTNIDASQPSPYADLRF